MKVSQIVPKLTSLIPARPPPPDATCVSVISRLVLPHSESEKIDIRYKLVSMKLEIP